MRITDFATNTPAIYFQQTDVRPTIQLVGSTSGYDTDIMMKLEAMVQEETHHLSQMMKQCRLQYPRLFSDE